MPVLQQIRRQPDTKRNALAQGVAGAGQSLGRGMEGYAQAGADAARQDKSDAMNLMQVTATLPPNQRGAFIAGFKGVLSPNAYSMLDQEAISGMPQLQGKMSEQDSAMLEILESRMGVNETQLNDAVAEFIKANPGEDPYAPPKGKRPLLFNGKWDARTNIQRYKKDFENSQSEYKRFANRGQTTPMSGPGMQPNATSGATMDLNGPAVPPSGPTDTSPGPTRSPGIVGAVSPPGQSQSPSQPAQAAPTAPPTGIVAKDVKSAVTLGILHGAKNVEMGTLTPAQQQEAASKFSRIYEKSLLVRYA